MGTLLSTAHGMTLDCQRDCRTWRPMLTRGERKRTRQDGVVPLAYACARTFLKRAGKRRSACGCSRSPRSADRTERLHDRDQTCHDAAGRQTLPLSRSGLRNVPSESSNGVRKLPLGFSVRSRKQLRARSGMPLVRQPVVCGGRSSARVGLAQQSHLLLRRCNGPLPHHRRHTLHPCLWWPHSS